ncbi:MAG: DUF2339 domain-containing protein [Phycisphaerales bacterium JB043]
MAHDHLRELQQSVEDLRDRVALIESWLSRASDTPRAMTSSPPRDTAAAPSAPAGHRATSAPASSRTPKRMESAGTEARRRSNAHNPSREISLERFVGGRLFAIAGAIVITAGIVFFSKYAWDQGWFNALAPLTKTLMSGAFGLILLIAARVIQLRLGSVASIGAYAAGLGVLYTTAFVAHARYELVSDPTGFLLFVLVSGLGVLISLSTNLASIGAFSIAGAYLTPLFFLHVQSSPAVLPLYLLSLIGLALVLASLKGGTFTRLRAMVWWGTIVFGSLWTLREGVDHPLLAIAFLGACWSSFHAELTLTSLHLRRDASRQVSVLAGFPSDIGARIIASSFSLTSWVTLLAALVLGRWYPELDWLAPGALFVATWTLALPLGGHLRVLRDRPSTDAERLASALITQAGALLVVTIALALGDWLAVVAWFALATASAVCGTWLRARTLQVYAIVVLVISTLRMITLEWWLTPTAMSGTQVYGLYLTRWTLLVALLALAWIASGACVRVASSGRWRAAANACIGVGISVLFASLFHERASTPAMIGALFSCALVLSIVSNRLRSFGLSVYAIGVGALGCLLIEASEYWTSVPSHAIAGIPVSTWTVLVIYASLVSMVAAWLLKAFHGVYAVSRSLTIVMSSVACVLAMASLAHESVDVESLTLAWLGIACLARLAHRLERRLALDAIATIMLVPIALAWAHAYVLPDWNSWSSRALLHPGLLVSMVIALAAVLIPRSMRSMPHDAPRRVIAMGGLVLALTILFTSSSYEVVRVSQIVTSDSTSQKTFLSTWWGLVSIALIAWGLSHRIPLLRHAGLALLSFAAIKTVTYDLVELAQLWRVVSFLALGLLMLVVATAYGRLAAQLDPEGGLNHGTPADECST